MQRVIRKVASDRDKGAVSVVVGLLIVPLIGFLAVAIDVAALYADRQQLQTGADAGALAIAQDCAVELCNPLTYNQTATELAVANKNDGSVSAFALADPAAGRVTVDTTTDRAHWFAPVLGFDSSTVTAEATVGWGAPTGGTAVLPMTLSLCEFNAQTGGILFGSTPTTIKFTKSSDTGCTGPSGNVVPGGFGWLSTDTGTCNTTSVVNETLFTSTGNSVPSGCQPEDFQSLQGATVLLPIFDEAGESGSSAFYKVHAYAAFTITGYYFADSKYRWNSACSGNERCISGYFTEYVELSDAFSYGEAPDLGSSVAHLILDDGA